MSFSRPTVTIAFLPPLSDLPILRSYSYNSFMPLVYFSSSLPSSVHLLHKPSSSPQLPVYMYPDLSRSFFFRLFNSSFLITHPSHPLLLTRRQPSSVHQLQLHSVPLPCARTIPFAVRMLAGRRGPELCVYPFCGAGFRSCRHRISCAFCCCACWVLLLGFSGCCEEGPAWAVGGSKSATG